MGWNGVGNMVEVEEFDLIIMLFMHPKDLYDIIMTYQ